MKKLSLIAISLFLVAIGVFLGIQQAQASNNSKGPPHANYVTPDENGCYPDTPSRGAHIQEEGWRQADGSPGHGIAPYRDDTIFYKRKLNEGFFTGTEKMAQRCVSGNHTIWPERYNVNPAYSITGKWAFPATVIGGPGNKTAEAAFINEVETNLGRNIFCTPADAGECKDQRRLALGAAFIIITMLENPRTGVGNSQAYKAENDVTYPANNAFTGIVRAQEMLGEWKELVKRYNDLGKVKWNVEKNFGYHYNSTSVGHQAEASDIPVFWGGPEHEWFIEFESLDGNPFNNYVLNKRCANTVGFLGELAKADYDHRAETRPGPSGLNRGGNIRPNATYTMTSHIWNNATEWPRFKADGTPIGIDGVQLRQVVTKGSQYIDLVSQEAANIAGEGANSSDVFKGKREGIFPNGDPANVADWPNGNPGNGGCGSGNARYCWFYTGLARKGASSGKDETFQDFTFKVKSDAPAGTNIVCFRATAYFRTSTDPTKKFFVEDDEFCLSIIVPDRPFVSTEEGDVHSGGQLSDKPCQLAGGAGSIQGRVSGGKGSYSTYAVSAGADINNFGSAKDAAGNNITFGNIESPNGQYGVICREDLAAKYLVPYITNGTLPDGGATRAAGIITNAEISSMGPGKQIIIVDGDLTIGNNPSAQAVVHTGRDITFVVRGNVLVNSRVNLSPAQAANRNELPAFGVIAEKNLYIHPAVTVMEGMYSAGTDPTRYPSGSADRALNPATIGITDTCRNAVNLPYNVFQPSIVASANSCGNALRVNGAIASRVMYFRRTAGNVNAASPTPAELLHFSAVVYLKPPSGFGSTSLEIRDQTERPPVL